MVDPRTELPDCYDITDEAVRDWHEKGTCLCRCGLPVGMSTPRGERRRKSYFYRNHHWNVMDKSKRSFPKQNGGVKRKAYFKEITMNPMFVGYLIDEYLEKHPDENKKTLARRAGIRDTTMYRICNGKETSIYKSTYIAIMDAIKEPIPKEWEKYRRVRLIIGPSKKKAA